MDNNFDKRLYLDGTTKYKVIIDTDPGVDDAACLIYAFFDEYIDIKLLTTVVGNISLEKATRNLLHLLDVFDVDIPVAKGAIKAMERESINAEFIHQKEGLGGYTPKNSNRKVLDENAIDAMYRVISNGNGDIIPIILGPQTNIGLLIKNHPDVINKIPKIVFMGGSPFGHPDYPDHVSFNISSDPEAFKIVLDSGIPLVMVPSDVGRRKAHLTQAFVNRLSTINKAGKLLADMYSKYWEPGYPDKRVATNDSLALFFLVYPKMFKTKKVSVTVDLNDCPGKTFIDFNDCGNVEMITDVDRQAFLSLLISDLEKLNDKEFNI
ncbi:MAG: nucleoside hydrolase [Clostridia bacterium]|nr:nucleoside hydrolase [Clostridia bacterium]